MIKFTARFAGPTLILIQGCRDEITYFQFDQRFLVMPSHEEKFLFLEFFSNFLHDSCGKIILSSYSPPNEQAPTTIITGDIQLWKPKCRKPVALAQLLTCGRMFDLGKLAMEQRSLVPDHEENPGIINNMLNISTDIIKFSAVVVVPWFCITHLRNESGALKTNHLAVLTSHTNITCKAIEALENTPLLLETKSSADDEDNRPGEEMKEEMSSILKTINPHKMKATQDAATTHIASNPSNADSFLPTTCSAEDHGSKDVTLEEIAKTLKQLLKITPEKMPALVGRLPSNENGCSEITNTSSVTVGQNAPKRDVCRGEIIAPVITQELTKHPVVTPPVCKLNFAKALKKVTKRTPQRGMCMNYFASFLKYSYL